MLLIATVDFVVLRFLFYVVINLVGTWIKICNKLFEKISLETIVTEFTYMRLCQELLSQLFDQIGLYIPYLRFVLGLKSHRASIETHWSGFHRRDRLNNHIEWWMLAY